MTTIHFESEDVWRSCCDASVMADRYGAANALRISQRLQQLEAMTSMDDLAFLPCDQRPSHAGYELTITAELVLLISTTHKGARVMDQPVITVLGIHTTSAVST